MEVKIVPLKSHKMQQNLLDKYYRDAKDWEKEGKPIAWCSGVAPSDILSSMDILVIFPENHAVICGARKVSTKLCQAAEARDYSQDLCSYSKNDMGSAFLGKDTLSPIGGLPRPDLLLISNNQCGTITKWFETLSRHFQVPLIVIDSPFLHDGMDKETIDNALKYVKRQLEETAVFLEEFTGKPFDIDKLREGVALTGESARLYKEIMEMCKHIPSPITCFDLFIHLFPMMCLRGQKVAVNYYEKLKAEVEERIAQGISAVPNERFRLFWDNIPVWFRLKENATLFASHDACVASAVYPYNWCLTFAGLDASKPIESLAEGVVLPFLNHGIKYRVDFISKLVEEYSIDGLVLQASRTCKPFFIGQYDIATGVKKKTGVPSVLIEGDMVDSRFYDDARVLSQIESFFEVLESNAKLRKGR